MKYCNTLTMPNSDQSRPARALWIEIVYSDGQCTGSKVEAREGLVD